MKLTDYKFHRSFYINNLYMETSIEKIRRMTSDRIRAEINDHMDMINLLIDELHNRTNN